MELTLSPAQQRVVGALAEKELSTPDNYPLSMNALLAACNQTTSRDPVVNFDEQTVDNVLANLRASGVARVVYSKGMRVDKYKHVLHEVLGLDKGELAIITVLLLRGPQTVNELRTRTERLHAFDGQAAVEDTLTRLSQREPAIVALLPRQPGQKEPRWAHQLGPTVMPASAAPATTEQAPPPLAVEPDRGDRIAALEARLAAVEARRDDAGL